MKEVSRCVPPARKKVPPGVPPAGGWSRGASRLREGGPERRPACGGAVPSDVPPAGGRSRAVSRLSHTFVTEGVLSYTECDTIVTA